MSTQKYSFKKNLLSSSIASALLATSTVAMAQEPALEEIEVTGVRAAQASAINTKRDAASVVDGISAEDIGKLPDVTISDSLQRITGVQVERSAGEAGAVQIRGLALVDTTLNGETFLSATTIDESGANFGDLPSQLFSGADIYKSPIATLTSNSIAGTVDLKTRRPFDFDDGFTFNAGVEVDQGSISKETDPTVSGLINWKGDSVGLMISAVTTEKNLATDFNGYFDTSEDGGIGAANNKHTWADNQDNDIDGRYIIPQGFAAFSKEEERERDGVNISFQADLGEGFELVSDWFYSDQTRYNRRAGMSANNRWQTFANYATATNLTGDTFTSERTFIDADGNEGNTYTDTWYGVNAFDFESYRLQSFAQTNVNQEESSNFNIELNYDNGGALTGGVRMTSGRATARMRHAYTEGDIMSIDNGTLVTGPGGLTPSQYCTNGEDIVGDQGGCFGQYSQGIEDIFTLNYDASGEHPVFSGFDQTVQGGKGERTIAEYMADIDSYHVGAFSSEGNTDDVGKMDTFSTKWNYAFEDTPFITSVDFGLRNSQRSIDHDVFSYFSEFAGEGCHGAQWKAVDQFLGAADEDDPTMPADTECDRGELVDGVWTPYTLLNPTPIDQYNNVIWVDSFGPVSGVPGVWVADPNDFNDPLAFHQTTFGNVQRVEVPGQSYDVDLNEFSYFAQANFEVGPVTGNFGVKVVDTDLTIKQNEVGASIPHSGTNADDGDVVTKRSYQDVLPSLNVTYNITDDLLLRGAYAETMQPLNLEQWGGGKQVGRVFQEECNCLRVNGGSLAGNTELDPNRATNYEVSLEWYQGDASLLSAGYFNIDIDSFTQPGVVEIDEPDDDGVFRGPWPFTTNVAGEGGSIEGLELAAKIALSDFVDVPVLSDFGFDVNYTYSDSSQQATNVTGGELPFPNNSEDTANFVAWYENDLLSARLAYNYRSERLVNANVAAVGGQSLYQDEYGQLDMNVTVNVTDNISVYLNGSNITEEYQQTYVEFKEQKAFQNIYEARWALGARFTY